jgi:O-antigen ligase
MAVIFNQTITMGFVLSVLYFVTYYLTPAVLFGPLAVARVELILAVLILLISLPLLLKSYILKTPQSLALIGLAFAGSLSVLFGMHWVMGAVQAFPAFIPCAYAYFLVCLHCNSKKKLQVIVLMLLFVCLFVIAHGYFDLRHGISQSGPIQSGATESGAPNLWEMEHPYILVMANDAGEMIYRLRGLGLIHDPNDFSQLIVCLIPLLFIFWRTNKMLWNIGFVILPVCVLLFGVFLTHSRGALLALMAIMIVAARRRIGTLPALIIAGGMFAAAMALNFTGGRDISATSGSDRTALWSSGLQMLKSHPFFGVGLGSFVDNCDRCGHTAHNSLVVCAAELGLVGLFFWAMFLFTSVRDALAIASPAKVSEGVPIIPKAGFFPLVTEKIEAVDKAEVNRLGRLMVLSLTGFLVAGWFLSRAYVMTFFLLGGMVEVVYEMAMQRGMIAPRLRLARVLPYSAGLAVLLVLMMYILLRIVNLMH